MPERIRTGLRRGTWGQGKTAMYDTYWGLQRPVFTPAAVRQSLANSPVHTEALARLDFLCDRERRERASRASRFQSDHGGGNRRYAFVERIRSRLEAAAQLPQDPRSHHHQCGRQRPRRSFPRRPVLWGLEHSPKHPGEPDPGDSLHRQHRCGNAVRHAIRRRSHRYQNEIGCSR